jgi:hypothetical protein
VNHISGRTDLRGIFTCRCGLVPEPHTTVVPSHPPPLVPRFRPLKIPRLTSAFTVAGNVHLRKLASSCTSTRTRPHTFPSCFQAQHADAESPTLWFDRWSAGLRCYHPVHIPSKPSDRYLNWFNNALSILRVLPVFLWDGMALLRTMAA